MEVDEGGEYPIIDGNPQSENSLDILNLNEIHSQSTNLTSQGDNSANLVLYNNPINESNASENDTFSNIMSVPSNYINLVPNQLSQSSVSASLNNDDSNSCTSPFKKRRLSEESQEDEDSQMCPICLDNWTTSGNHRLCSLKCGHLFGYNCIKRWLESETKKLCPTCKKKVHINEIRYIYARKVIAMDTTELTITKQKLENAIEDKNRIQIELSKAICRVHMLTEEVEEYKKKINAMMYAKQAQNEFKQLSNQPSSEVIHLYKEKSIDLGKNSSCRVLNCRTGLDITAISMKSSNNLYSGFGIKTLNILNFKPIAFIPLHNKPIRDIKFHENEPWLLSCSVDKKIKILDLNINNTTMTFESKCPLWSCCWDIDNNRTLYVGQQQGSVLKFDIRQPTEPTCTISVEGDCSPVVSVQAIKSCSLFEFGGVISCKLNSVWAFETTPQEPIRHPLPLEGPFISMVYHKNNEHVLLSSRPNSRHPYTRHFLCGLNKANDNVMCDIVHTFHGGNTQTMLTRTCFLTNKNDYAAAYVEDQRVVSLWNINTGNKVATVPAHESVLDLNSVKTDHNNFLLSLTESKLDFFKFSS